MDDKIKTLGRREFLITLGAGTSLAIAGFFTFDSFGDVSEDITELPKDTNQSELPLVHPKLSEQIKQTVEENRLVLTGEKAKCFVNRTGEKIIGLLDGKHTLSHIATQLSDYYSIAYSDALEVSIASFICQLGTQGFLSSPFYVTMYENY